MNRYGITINQHTERIQLACSAHTAVDREMSRHVEGEFKPHATIKVRFIGKVSRTWYIVAEVPFDYGDNRQGYMRKQFPEEIESPAEAHIRMRDMIASHPEYKHVRLVTRNKA